jgi:hypothetical protein
LPIEKRAAIETGQEQVARQISAKAVALSKGYDDSEHARADLIRILFRQDGVRSHSISKLS